MELPMMSRSVFASMKLAMERDFNGEGFMERDFKARSWGQVAGL